MVRGTKAAGAGRKAAAKAPAAARAPAAAAKAAAKAPSPGVSLPPEQRELSNTIAERVVELLVGPYSGALTEIFSAKVIDQISGEVVKQVSGELVKQISSEVVSQLAGKLAGTTEADKSGPEEGTITVKTGAEKIEANTPASLPQNPQDSASAAGSKRPSPEADKEVPPAKKTKTMGAKTMGQEALRRNPKRAASETASNVPKEPSPLGEDLLKEALRPLTDEEIAAWGGWVEVESEPAFFDHIIRKLNVNDVTVKELMTLDEWGLGTLPQPVHGLIFLFQYAPQLNEEEDEDADDSLVWFANQTAANSCASVAILNIIMNADGIDLGDELRQFKESTKDLCSPLRGYQVGTNSFIRTAHNSFARRIDQLCADYSLAQEVAAAPTQRRNKAPAKGKGKPKAKATKKLDKKSYQLNGFHFIAYVPAGGFVWELDGMNAKPRKVGTAQPEDWLSIAAPRIQQRIDAYDKEVSFNLLALCRSSLPSYRSSIAESLSCMRWIKVQRESDGVFADLIAEEDRNLSMEDPASLHEFNLDPSEVAATLLSPFTMKKVQASREDVQSALIAYNQLVSSVKFSMAKYREEIATVAEEEECVRRRKMDYTPALHTWMTKLVEKGILEEMLSSSQ
ncbi:hypothetical protein HIM_08212 [Hirsutella minnesotensis 3608]|uniref:Ubiquitin carboxyl-terminal hydrolase n=1 Tax=Hirsutella minnesotensis 3608 TaxID=1043627 RepID=A0A0F8A3T9_9HYPO|nr:hypothetical protein HIM_08212 [Hirsutella minnesotensis 3608]